MGTAVYIQERSILQSGSYYKETFFKIHLMLQKNRIGKYSRYRTIRRVVIIVLFWQNLPKKTYYPYLCCCLVPTKIVKAFLSSKNNLLIAIIFGFVNEKKK